MSAFFAGLIDYLSKAASWILDGFLWILKTALFLPFDGLLTVIQSMITGLNVAGFAASYAMQWAGLPSQLIYVVNAVGLAQCITILLAAITLRMLINLIPAAFTRI